jgi:pyruvate dehydrogenase E2 component (dihydrolipoamide acetyltransferase)
MARRVQGWRKLAGAAWGRPSDPQFFGDLELDAGALLSYIDEVRRLSGVHITMTHLVGRAVAHGLVTVPKLRGRTRVLRCAVPFRARAARCGQCTGCA